jgi:hypothetical protein
VPHLPFVATILIAITVTYYVIGFIDRKKKLSLYELEADLLFFNPVIGMIEKLLNKKLKELLNCLIIHQETLSHQNLKDG